MAKKLVHTLRDRANQVEQTTALLIQKTSDYQQIKKYLISRILDIPLTPTQQEKLERYQFIYNQIISGKYSESEVVNCVMKLYSVDIRQAYIDLDDTKDLFTTVLSIKKMFELKVELESARQLKRKCEDIENYMAAAAIQRNIVRILDQIQQEETLPAEVFEGHELEAVFDPTLIGAPAISNTDIRNLLNKINVKRGKKINIEDIGFEEVQ